MIKVFFNGNMKIQILKKIMKMKKIMMNLICQKKRKVIILLMEEFLHLNKKQLMNLWQLNLG